MMKYLLFRCECFKDPGPRELMPGTALVCTFSWLPTVQLSPSPCTYFYQLSEPQESSSRNVGVFPPITMFMILIMLSFVASAYGNFASWSLWLPDKYVCQYWRSVYFIIQFMPSAYMTNHGNQSNIFCTNDG